MAEQRYLYLTAKNACHYVNSITECEKKIRFMHILLPQVRHNLILLGSQNLEYLIKLSFQYKMKKENPMFIGPCIIAIVDE